ncbi:MAG: hypothetical protein HY907_14090 [Deltaproteobacteria bacterium]|nr:hypothetical protein [Deltaproteobacteria bacterium]
MSRSLRIVLAASLLLLAAAGCHRGSAYVYVDSQRYIPQMPVELRAYQGQPIFLTTFVNLSPNTTREYYYYSPDGSVTYEVAPTLAGFVRDSFARAMAALGMQVILDPPPPLDPRVAELQLAVTSWDDFAFHCQIVLNKYDATLYQQEYRVEFPRLLTDNVQALEDRVYRIADAAIAGMLADQGFQQAFFQ